VSNVDDGSVAAEAGVMAGDVITSLDGRVVDSASLLRRRLSGVDAGDEVSIGVTRGGRELSLTATLTDARARAHRYQVFGEDDSTLE
jgi:S1-C subfamily serine protease